MSPSNDDDSKTMQPPVTAKPETDAASDPQLAPDPQLDAETTMRERRGIVMVLTGDGKGKSTSAFGTIARALGWDQRVGVVQFVKGEWETGEKRFFAAQPGVDWIVSGDGFDWRDEDKEQSAQSAMEAFAQAAAMMVSNAYDLIVLDEVNWAMAEGDLDPRAVMQAIAARDKTCTVVLTGRNAPPEALEAADLVTEMANVRHPHRDGLIPLRGVDY